MLSDYFVRKRKQVNSENFNKIIINGSVCENDIELLWNCRNI